MTILRTENTVRTIKPDEHRQYNHLARLTNERISRHILQHKPRRRDAESEEDHGEKEWNGNVGRKWFDCVYDELEEGAAMTVMNEVQKCGIQLGHLRK
jgi:hypothetical protein